MAIKKTTKPHDAALKQLRSFGLSYPGTHTKSPWPGHLDLAVNDKTFAYLSVEGEPLSISCKLPGSGTFALGMPFTAPTGYGLGRSGWVTATFSPKDAVPIDLLKEWIDESYRAQAPKRLSATLHEKPPEAPSPPNTSRARPTKRKRTPLPKRA